MAAGARYVGRQYIAEDNAFAIEDYLTVDTMVFLQARPAKAVLDFKNLTDREYETRGFGAASAIPAIPLRSTRESSFPLAGAEMGTGRGSSGAAGKAAGSAPGAATVVRPGLDAWVRELMQWHFTPERAVRSGSNGRAAPAGIPRREVQRYDDLDKFGGFQDEWLRGGPVRRWVPQAYAIGPSTSSKPAAAPGVPKSRINIDDFRIDYEMFSQTLPDEFFPKGADWLQVGPSGPRRLRLAIEHLAQHRGGICFAVDLDPRWVIKLIKWGEMEMVERLQAPRHRSGAHALQSARRDQVPLHHAQAARSAVRKISLKKAGITGVFCGGTEMTPQFHRFAVEELMEGAYFAPTYGNTLMGLATHKPRECRRQLGDHLLPALTARGGRGRQSRPAGPAWSGTGRPAACA